MSDNGYEATPELDVPPQNQQEAVITNADIYRLLRANRDENRRIAANQERILNEQARLEREAQEARDAKAPKTLHELLKRVAQECERHGPTGLADWDLDDVGSLLDNIAEHMALGLKLEDAWEVADAAPTNEARANAALIKNVREAVRAEMKSTRGSGGTRGRGAGRARGRGRGRAAAAAGGAAETCARCGRVGHVAANCFATTNVQGIRL